MNPITIMIDGVPKTFTDIALLRAELDVAQARLNAIFVNFDPDRAEQLLDREPEIVELRNRREDLREAIERWDADEVAKANILAGWDLVKELKGDAS